MMIKTLFESTVLTDIFEAPFTIHYCIYYDNIFMHPTFDFVSVFALHFVGEEMSETRSDEVASGSRPKALSTRG